MINNEESQRHSDIARFLGIAQHQLSKLHDSFLELCTFAKTAMEKLLEKLEEHHKLLLAFGSQQYLVGSYRILFKFLQIFVMTKDILSSWYSLYETMVRLESQQGMLAWDAVIAEAAAMRRKVEAMCGKFAEIVMHEGESELLAELLRLLPQPHQYQRPSQLLEEMHHLELQMASGIPVAGIEDNVDEYLRLVTFKCLDVHLDIARSNNELEVCERMSIVVEAAREFRYQVPRWEKVHPYQLSPKTQLLLEPEEIQFAMAA